MPASTMASTPTPPLLDVAEPPHLGTGSSDSMLVRPFARIELQPPPSEGNSGLFPALDEATPAEHGGAGLRRAVLMTVVVGAVSLLAYASWQRVSTELPPGSSITRAP